MENWIIFSFLSGLIFAIVNTIDKYKVFDSINLSHPVFCIFAGFSNLILGLLFITFFPIQDTSYTNILLGISTGVLQGFSIGLMFKALSQNEVTRVVPIYQTYPIYVLIIALLFLNEILTSLQIISIFLMLAGGILATIEFKKKMNFSSGFMIFILIVASISMAVSHIFIKTLIEEFSTLQIYGLRGIGVSIPLILPFSSKSNLKKFYIFLKDWRSSRFMFLAETVGACIGLILIILALDSGSVSLVAAISSGTRPIFVVIIGLFLSLIGKKIKEEFDIYNGLIKISSAVFVGIGILLVSINI
ncbi:MAG TPA: EamA family transporter [Dehalococcoidia bacterium]|nr:EamA family transporter [Dehalococcoidia bacterium]